jgi:hypothetical protein
VFTRDDATFAYFTSNFRKLLKLIINYKMISVKMPGILLKVL